MSRVRKTRVSSYFSRLKVKFRRRREGKTNYRSRMRMVLHQNYNAYNLPKYRLVVRFSNSRTLCQIVSSTDVGDKVVSSAYSHELWNYGLKVGFKNYSATYCTGLLCARRCLERLKLLPTKEINYRPCSLSDNYNEKKVTKRSHVAGTPRPFTVILDTGLKRTSTGSRVFAAMMGALNGGLTIPHNIKHFPGYDKTNKKCKDEIIAKYLHGGHVADYMSDLKDEEPDAFRRQFSTYIEQGINPAAIPLHYSKVEECLNHASHYSRPWPKYNLFCSQTMNNNFSKNIFATQSKNGIHERGLAHRIDTFIKKLESIKG